MEITPQIFTAKVMHKRLTPKVNAFTYRIYYLVLPLATLRDTQQLPINRAGIMSLHEKDFGARDGSCLHTHIRAILRDYGLSDTVDHIQFITMPRIIGYAFNPVSFYLCYDAEHALRAVISEVHNTFGEAHSYLCAHEDHRPINADDTLHAQKLFHVSPFLDREGSYRFRFALKDDKAGIFIDHLTPDGQLMLITSLAGTLQPMTRAALIRAFLTHPLVTFKAISLIHWQALKLFAKGIRYRVKPPQNDTKLSASGRLTKL